MSIKRKVYSAACLLLCILMLLPCLAPMSAHAEGETEIEKLTVKVSPKPVALMQVKGVTASTSTNGTNIISYNWYDTEGNVIDGTFGAGETRIVVELAAQPGYIFSEELSVYLNDEQAEFAVDDTGTKLRLQKTFSPVLMQPTIIKNPKGENVVEGDRASFTASANYANEYKWTIKGPDGESLGANQIAGRFPTCTVKGDGTGSFAISGIPLQMDGWKVICTLTGPGGSVTSLGAEIKVEPNPDAAPAEKTEAEVENADGDHVHEFSEKWFTNSRYHWHKCVCGEVSEKAEHDFQWKTVKKASKKGSGLEKGVCSTCGYEVTRELEYKETVRDNAGLKIIKLIIVAVLLVIVGCVAVFGIQVARSNRYKSRSGRRR